MPRSKKDLEVGAVAHIGVLADDGSIIQLLIY